MPNQRGPACRQAGFAPILILLAALGIIVFLLISSSAPFKDKLFSTLFPKPPSHAAEPSVPGEIIVKFKAGVDDEAKDNVRHAGGLEKKAEIDQIGVELDKVPDEAKDKIIEALSHNPRVEYAEPNILGQIQDIPNDPAMATSNSLTYPNAWHLYKIAASQAWDISKGNPAVVVAVIDSGVKSDHEDLVGKILPGYNYYSNSTDTSDVYGHGTAVAGVVAAATNNSLGIASLGRDVTVMPLVACGSTGSCSSFATTNSLIYAVDNGAKVANISIAWGSSISSMQSAINYAWSKGVITVAAAGNYGSTPLVYPASEPIVISAGMSDSSDSWNGSNYGTNLDVIAPGVSIYTTTKSGVYSPISGTSFSSPLTAALVALIFSARPDLTPQQVTDIITQTADKVGGVTYDSNGWNDHYGYGRINAGAALQKAVGSTSPPPDTVTPTISITSPSDNSTVSGLVDILANASDNVRIVKTELYIDSKLYATDTLAPFVFSWDTTKTTNNSHYIYAKTYDGVGNSGISAVTVTVNNPISTPTPSPIPISTDTTPPAVFVSNPANGSVVKSNSTVNIQAQASDNTKVSKVEFFVNNSLKCTSTVSPYTCSWKVPGKKNTNYTLSAKAYDSSSNTTTATSKVTAN